MADALMAQPGHNVGHQTTSEFLCKCIDLTVITKA